MANVRAKLKCNSVTLFADGSKKASLSAVYGNDGENADFAKFTPSAQLEITISAETKAVDFFQPGKDCYLTFENA